MNVYLLVLWGDSLTYTLAKALVFNGYRVTVYVADPQRHRRAIWGAPQRIAAIPGIQILTYPSPCPEERIDHLVVQGHPLLTRCSNALDEFAPNANKITVISSGDRSRSYRRAIRLQMKEWRAYGRWFTKWPRVAYKDGHYPIDLFTLFKSRRVVGFDPHARFLQDEALFHQLHDVDWKCDERRPVRANFIGSRDPAIRGQILDDVKSFFERPDSYLNSHQSMLLHAYTDAQPAALDPENFVKALSESDFTLAPPGYSLVTHRPVEALLRGSIPVLNAAELDLYDIGLVDAVNCIAVRQGNWQDAMNRITGMNGDAIVAMRRNIQSMLADTVSYPALSRHICRRLGLEL